MKKIILSALCALVSTTFFGQFTNPDGSGGGSGGGGSSSSSGLALPNIVPPSPEASGLARFIDVPVSHYTGMPNISIPIYTINESGIQIPISLSYHARGVQVTDVAPRTGTGWSLTYGGSLSRQIRGKADDTGFPYGYMKNRNEFMNYASSRQARVNVENREVLDAGYDFYPDQFSFNAGGASGKFILNYDDFQPLIKTYQDVKIAYQRENGFSGKIKSFQVTDANGNKFYYGVSKDGQRTGLDFQYSAGWTYYHNGNIVRDPSSSSSEQIYSSWKLMDIETAYGELISYHYIRQSFVNYSKSYDSHDAPSGSVNSAAGMSDLSKIHTRFTKTTSYENQLHTITFSTGKIVFDKSSTLRQDYNGYTLDKISIFDKNNSLIKAYKLNYHYTTSTDQSNVLHTIKSNTSAFQKSLKRLFLSSVEEENKQGDKLPPYRFTYNSTVLPSRFSSSQDYWGYYNGADNGPFLRLFNYGNYTSDRRVDPQKSEAGLLKEITNPTGGKTTFTYEDNVGKSPSFYHRDRIVVPNVNPNTENEISLRLTKSDFIAPGDRSGYKTITVPKGTAITFRAECRHLRDVNDTTTPDCIFEFSVNGGPKAPNTTHTLYTSGGLPVANQPDYVNMTFLVSAPRFPGVDPNLHSDPDYDFIMTIRYVNEDDLINLYAGGKRIKRIETIDEHGSTFKEFEYPVHGNGYYNGQIVGLPAYINKTTYNGLEFLTHVFNSESRYGSFQPNTIGYAKVIEYSGTKNNNLGKTEYTFTNYADSGEDYYNFPYHPSNDNEWLRGKNLNTKVFKKNENGSYSLVKDVVNTYTYGGTLLSSGVDKNFPDHLGLRHVQFPSTASFDQNIATDFRVERTIFTIPFFMRKRYDPINPLNVSGYRIYNITGGVQKLESTTQTSYFDTGNATTQTKYLYNFNKHYQLSGTEVYNSEGEAVKSKTYYPSEVTSTTSLGYDALSSSEKQAIDRLKLNHRIATPVQTEIYKNNALQNTQRTIFKHTNGIDLPGIIQASKGGRTLEDRIVYHRYDSKRNPIEVSKKDGTKIYYVWGYNGSQPIAKIEGYTSISSTQQSAINNAIAASNNEYSDSAENTLRSRLQTLRNSFTGTVQITSYTYNPLIGVTSITDPRGKTLYYEYDDFNRLHLVKNSDGNIINENLYHYKNQ